MLVPRIPSRTALLTLLIALSQKPTPQSLLSSKPMLGVGGQQFPNKGEPLLPILLKDLLLLDLDMTVILPLCFRLPSQRIVAHKQHIDNDPKAKHITLIPVSYTHLTLPTILLV